MFADFLRRLTAPGPEPLAPPDARLALAALLVRVARADHAYSETERQHIDRVMIAREGFSKAEAEALRAEAEVLETEAPDTVRFTRAIKEAVPLIDRLRVMEALWDVALADGQRDHEEDMALRLVANLLGVSDVESGLARQRVEARRP